MPKKYFLARRITGKIGVYAEEETAYIYGLMQQHQNFQMVLMDGSDLYQTVNQLQCILRAVQKVVQTLQVCTSFLIIGCLRLWCGGFYFTHAHAIEKKKKRKQKYIIMVLPCCDDEICLYFYFIYVTCIICASYLQLIIIPSKQINK